MPTYTFTRTRSQVADKIGRLLGVKEEGQTLTAEDAAIINEGIDLRLKELHSLGLLWWNISGAASNVTLTSGTATASTPADFLFPVTMKVRVGTEDCPVDIISHREYQDIPEKTDQGIPRVAFFPGGLVYVWPVPQTGYTAKLTYQAIAADTEINATPDVPVAVIKSLSELVAGDLTEDFNVSAERMGRLMQRMGPAMATIRAVNTERVDSTPVAPTWY